MPVLGGKAGRASRLLIELPYLDFVHVVQVLRLCGRVANIFVQVFQLGIEIHDPIFVFLTFALALTLTVAIAISLVRWRLWMRRACGFIHFGPIVRLNALTLRIQQKPVVEKGNEHSSRRDCRAERR
jgi:hypothetical protein